MQVGKDVEMTEKIGSGEVGKAGIFILRNQPICFSMWSALIERVGRFNSSTAAMMVSASASLDPL